MAIITEVRFAHEDGALAGTLRSLPELAVSVVRETSTTPGQGVYFFRFDDVDPDEIHPALEADHTVKDARQVPSVGDRRLWRIEFAPEANLLAPKVTRQRGFVIDARSSLTQTGTRGWRERWFFPEREGIHDIWQQSREDGFEFEVLDLSQRLRTDVGRVDSDALTDEQRTALLAAYDRGYFSEPRETSLEELAETLGLSPSAVSGRLKRGMKSLIETTLVVEGQEEGEPERKETAEYRTGASGLSVRVRSGEQDE